MKRKRKRGFRHVIGCHKIGDKGENDIERIGWVCVSEREKVEGGEADRQK